MRTLILALAAFTATQLAFADDFRPEKFACVSNHNDLYEPGAVMHFGRDKGKCIDTKNQRPPVVISDSPIELVIANFYYNEKFWIAKIDKREVDNVTFQWIRFDPLYPKSDFAHAQLHFIMNKRHPVELQSQIIGQSATTATLASFVISSNPFFPRNATAGGRFDAFTNQIGVDTHVAAFDGNDLDKLYNGKPRSREIPLGLDSKDRAHLLDVAIAQAIKRGYNDAYNGATRNCNVMAFEALDEAFPPDRPVHSVKVGLTTLFDPVIGPATDGLNEREFSVNVKTDKMECVSNQSLRLHLTVDGNKPLLAKVGLDGDNFQSMTMTVPGDPYAETVKIEFKDDATSSVLETWNCERAAPCERHFDWDPWEHREIEMEHEGSDALMVKAYKALTAMLASELQLTSACENLGSDALAQH